MHTCTSTAPTGMTQRFCGEFDGGRVAAFDMARNYTATPWLPDLRPGRAEARPLRWIRCRVWPGRRGRAGRSPPSLTAQSRAPEVSGDWPMYSHSLSGQRYSPLTEITPANVARLAPAWSLRLTQPAAGRRGGGPPPAAPVVERCPRAGQRGRHRRQSGGSGHRQQPAGHADRDRRRDVSARTRQPGAGARRRHR